MVFCSRLSRALFATAAKSEAPLFSCLAEVAERRLGHFNSQDLANTAWAFATVAQSEAPLFARLAKASQRRLSHFNAQNLANMAWAFATVVQSEEPLFARNYSDTMAIVSTARVVSSRGALWAWAATFAAKRDGSADSTELLLVLVNRHPRRRNAGMKKKHLNF